MKNDSILIVDPEELMRKWLADALSDNGFQQVSSVASGTEVLDFLDKARPALVITELVIPGMDGLTVLKKIKEKYPDTTVIIVTGHGTPESATNALRLGAYDYISKPFLITELVLVIKKALMRSQNREQKSQGA